MRCLNGYSSLMACKEHMGITHMMDSGTYKNDCIRGFHNRFFITNGFGGTKELHEITHVRGNRNNGFKCV